MESITDSQQVALTKNQYEALLKLVYLGNWVANAQRDGSPGDPLIQEFEDTSDLMFSLAPRFGLEKYVAHEHSDGTRYYPTREFEEDTSLHDLIEEYDEGTFWEELVDALGDRDFHEKYTDTEIEQMSVDESMSKLYECLDVWDGEFVEFGIDRLSVDVERG